MEAYRSLYTASADWSKPFKRLAAVAAIRGGADPRQAAREFGTTPARLNALSDASKDPVKEMFGLSWDEAGNSDGKARRLAARGLGQMMLGSVAERAFETLFRREVGTGDLLLSDLRDARNDTDYHVRDASDRPVFRFNIKSHGTQFRNARELVGLEPDNCFALATYKIYQGLLKEEDERLPYVFVVATTPSLTGELIGLRAPEPILRLATLLKASKGVDGLGKRDVEERMVAVLLGDGAPEQFKAVRDEVLITLESADWRALSARKADRLLRTLLFDRVYAVKVRGFAQNYPNAELDMHFSLSGDMTSLHEFVRIYKDEGLHKLTSMLARGDI